MKNIQYGVRKKNTDSLLKIKTIHLKGEQENQWVYRLSIDGEKTWLVDDVTVVKNALNNPRKWYESTENGPYITEVIDELEIVEVSDIRRVDTYAPHSIYEDLDSYHRQKVEEALRRHEQKKDQRGEPVDETSSMHKEHTSLPSNQTEAKQQIAFVSPTNITKTKTKPMNSPVKHDPVVTLKEKKTIKVKVKCIQDMVSEADEHVRCFKKGKAYLAYIKEDKLFILNEDKIPEFICNALEDEKWKTNTFFRQYFTVEAFLN